MSDEAGSPFRLAQPPLPSGRGNGNGHSPPSKERLTAEVGRTGPREYGGIVFEEYDPELRGPRAIRTYDEMRRTDPTIAVGLRAISWVLGQVNWTAQPGGDSMADKEAAAFLETCLSDMSHTWSKFIRDALTCLPFGFAFMEITYKQRNGSEPPGDAAPSEYDDGRMGWRKISLIGHDTLLRWDLEPDGSLRGFVQQAYGANPEILIPVEKAILFRLDDEKNNPEGLSLLRPCYLPWYMKKNLQEVEAIGIERDLSGVLIIYMPVNATSSDHSKAKQLLEQFKRDDMSGFIAPQFGPGEHERWRFEIINAPGSKAVDTDRTIRRYQHEIARSFLTQFLMLGDGTSGSWALGRDQREMFEVALGAILQNLEETINRFLVKPLFRINDFGKLTAPPRLKAGRISKGDLQKFSQALSQLIQAGALTAGPDIEKFVRDEMELPELTDKAIKERADKAAQQAQPSAQPPTSPTAPQGEAVPAVPPPTSKTPTPGEPPPPSPEPGKPPVGAVERVRTEPTQRPHKAAEPGSSEEPDTSVIGPAEEALPAHMGPTQIGGGLTLPDPEDDQAWDDLLQKSLERLAGS